MTSFFSGEGGPIWIKFRRLVQNDMSTAVIWSKSKSEVEFQYGGRLGEFNGISSQSHVVRCRVGLLQLGEFTVMIPEPHATLQGVISPPGILKIVVCHILFYFCFFNGLQQVEEDVGLSVGAAWIAGQDRSMWRTLRPSAGQAQQWVSEWTVWALTSGGFRIVSNTLVFSTMISSLLVCRNSTNQLKVDRTFRQFIGLRLRLCWKQRVATCVYDLCSVHPCRVWHGCWQTRQSDAEAVEHETAETADIRHW